MMYLGDWYRPMKDLAMLAAIGVQFVIGHEDEGGSVSRAAYKAACRAVGLRYVLQIPVDDATLQLEAQDDYCLGWDQPDEPNDNPTPSTATTLRADYLRCKAAAPMKIVLLNLDGWQQWSDFDYIAAAACCDWLMFDYYVKNRDGKLADVSDELRPIISRFQSYLKPHQLLGYFIETSDQLLTMQSWNKVGVGPTPDDIEEYFTTAVSTGCTVLGLFSDVIGLGFVAFDGTSADAYQRIRGCVTRYVTPLPGPGAGPSVPPPPPTFPAYALQADLALQASRVDALFATEKGILATLQKAVNNVAYLWQTVFPKKGSKP